MNLVTALGIYVAVNRELGEELVFPSSDRLYFGFDAFTYSRLHAQFCAACPSAYRGKPDEINGKPTVVNPSGRVRIRWENTTELSGTTGGPCEIESEG